MRFSTNQAGLSKLPAELLHQVFEHLSSIDFHAVRSSSARLWKAGASRLLLCKMLLRGGWWTSAQAGLESLCFYSEKLAHERQLQYLDQCLERECSLQPRNASPTSLVQTTSTDFSDLALDTKVTLSASTCTQYLLATAGCNIYIYSLFGSQLHPFTSITCPRRVVTVAMDTSGGGHTLAAILEGRMGLVCDLQADGAANLESPSPCVYGDHSLATDEPMSSWFGQEFYTEILSGSSGRINSIHIRSAHQRVSLLNASQHSPLHQATMIGRDTTPLMDYAPRCAPYSVSIGPLRQNVKKVPLEYLEEELPACRKATPVFPLSSAPFSVYHSLCSSEDPPRSVSLCPVRHCVAWGCETGVELHWVDVLSGRNLMKWFPMTTPSDYLFFLPNRIGNNSDRVSLFSSKASPKQRTSSGKYGAGEQRTLDSSIHTVRADNKVYDHFAAVPLSDGQHLLFTEPSTGYVCLGSDSPLPSLGAPSAFLRKLTFVPPESLRSKVTSKNPATIYSASPDLSWGLRAVVIYDETMVLYCVPPDIMADMSKFTGSSLSPVHEGLEEYTLSTWYKWWDFKETSNKEQLPLPVYGSVVNKVDVLVSLIVQGSSDFTVWGLFANGSARTWAIGRRSKMRVVERYIDREGMVRDSVDQDGDRIMRDVRSDRKSPIAFGGDGIVELDRDGDVVMRDAWAQRAPFAVLSSRHCVEAVSQQEIFTEDGRSMSRVEFYHPAVRRQLRH